MKILVDTNVLLDVLTKRAPFYQDSAKVWTLIEQGLIVGYISAISVNNIYYIVKRLENKNLAENVINKLLGDFKVVDLTGDILVQSKSGTSDDFEDSIQYFSAVHAGCEAIVTRNKKDFPSLGLTLITPGALIAVVVGD